MCKSFLVTWDFVSLQGPDVRVISRYFAFRRGPLEMELTYDSLFYLALLSKL